MASTRVPITEGASGTYRWYVLGLLTLTSAFSVADRLVFGILVEDIKAEFALSDFELGLLGGAAFSLVYVLAGFPAARLADRSTRKNIVASAISFWSLMTAACGMATGFWTLFAARTGVGVGEGCSGPSSQSLVADYFTRAELAKAMGYLTIGASMGTAGGLIIGGQLAEIFDWRWAFVLFGLLQSLNMVFSASPDFIGATRLVTQSRVSFTQSLPMRMVPEMDAIPGVQRVMYQQWFGGVYQDNPQIFTFAVDPERLHDVYPEWVMPEEHWNAFRDTRTGMIAGKLLADRYGWKVGDRIPLKSNIFPQKNNSKDWEFELVGIFDGQDEEWRRQTSASVFINHAYFAEAALFGGGMAGIFVLRLEDPDMAESIATLVDQRYENSSDETKTQTEKDFNVGFVKQLGDIGMIVRWILFAVFFTLLLVVGNTMAQSVRERVPQFAVLKTLGFSDNSVLAFVLAETLALCAIGGLVGLGLATALGAVVAQAAGPMLPIAVDGRVWMAGVVAIFALSLVATPIMRHAHRIIPNAGFIAADAIGLGFFSINGLISVVSLVDHISLLVGQISLVNPIGLKLKPLLPQQPL